MLTETNQGISERSDGSGIFSGINIHANLHRDIELGLNYAFGF